MLNNKYKKQLEGAEGDHGRVGAGGLLGNCKFILLLLSTRETRLTMLLIKLVQVVQSTKHHSKCHYIKQMMHSTTIIIERIRLAVIFQSSFLRLGFLLFFGLRSLLWFSLVEAANFISLKTCGNADELLSWLVTVRWCW